MEQQAIVNTYVVESEFYNSDDLAKIYGTSPQNINGLFKKHSERLAPYMSKRKERGDFRARNYLSKQGVVVLATIKDQPRNFSNNLDLSEKSEQFQDAKVALVEKVSAPVNPFDLMRQMIDSMEATNARLDRLEAKAELNSSLTGYYSIKAFCVLHNLRIDLREAGRRGKLATKRSKELNVVVAKQADQSFGIVNVYREDILEEVFEDLIN